MHPTTLALLPALDALLDECSVTGAAQRLHLSAPATSRTLDRLRHVLQDPLLVRAGRRMVPTARASELRAQVRHLMEQARDVFATQDAVVAGGSGRVMTIRTNEAAAAIFGLDLSMRAALDAPGLLMRFVAQGGDDIAPLRDGSIDLDIGLARPDLAELKSQAVLQDHMVLLMKRANPLARGRLTLQRFLRADHVITSHDGRLRTPIDDALAAQGVQRRIALVVPTYLAASISAAAGKAVTVVPQLLAVELSAVLDVAIRALPFDWPAYTLYQLWHPRLERDATHRWLRDQVLSISNRKRQSA